MKYVEHAEELLEILMRFKKIMRVHPYLEELNFSEMVVCGVLAHKEAKQMQMKDISDVMKISRPALNAIVNRLEDKSLVERFRLEGDRKSVYLRLSEKSYHIYHKEHENLIQSMNNIVQSMGKEDTLQLIKLLKKFYDVSKQEVDNKC
jgi:DNA-binding MarR family transcriptional regulator